MEFQALISNFGIDYETTLLGAAIVIGIINLLKDWLGIEGKKEILVSVAVMGPLVSALMFYPDMERLLRYAIVFPLGGIMLWSTGKRMAHKVGKPSSLRPDSKPPE